MPAHDIPYFEPAGGQNAEASSVAKAFGMADRGRQPRRWQPLRAGHRRRVVARRRGRRPGASLPGPAPPASAAGGRSPGSPRPGHQTSPVLSPPRPGRAVAPELSAWPGGSGALGGQFPSAGSR